MSQRKRVLVTRAPNGASTLAEHLHSLGLDPILIPAIATADPSSFAALDAALDGLASFGWLVFTSATAVQAFADRLKAAPAAASLPSTLQIAAIGPATAQAAATLGPVAAIPPQAVAESLLATLLPHARQPDGTPTRFLLVRAEEARDVVPEGLQAAGAQVTVAPAYRTVIPEASVDQIRRLFANSANHPDAITFTSSSTARNLVSLCQAAQVRLPETALRVSIGPITTQTLNDLGLPPHAEAREANVLALAEEVLRVLELKQEQG